MFGSVGLIALGLALLVGGGEALVRGAVGLAVILRLTPAVIGLTVVAAGTSVPELAVSMIAANQGSPDIAVANVVGSNIFNIAAILGICALVRPLVITGNTIKLEYPVLALASVLVVVMARDGEISRLDAAICLAVYVGFTVYMIRLVRQQVTVAESLALQGEVRELTPAAERPRVWMNTAMVLVGVALLAAGAQATVTGAVGLARLLGWSERVIGLTIVAAGTSLPEVMASLVSALRGRSDIAIGNVIGSNLFNILVILGLSATVAPLPVQPGLITSDFWWMLGVTLLLFPFMLTGLRIGRWEGGVFAAVYVSYIALLVS